MEPEKPKAKLSIRERLAAKREDAANDPRWQRAGWLAVKERLRTLFPTTPDLDLSADALTQAATTAGVSFDFVLLRNPWRADPKGKGTISFEELAEEALFDSVFEEHPPAPGPVWFVPHDLLFELDEPYLVTGETLRTVVTTSRHSLVQDVLFIWTETPRVSLIHHEGGYAHIFLPH
jgi:hypothetical protein